MQRIKKLPIGVRRLLLMASGLSSIIIILLASANVNWGFMKDVSGYLIGICLCLGFGIGGFIAFWLITRIILWIIDGFGINKS